MKRVADTQLVKDSEDRDTEEDVEDVGRGFKKADDAVLATRKIRGLPKRTTSSDMLTPASPPSAISTESTTSKFNGFTGFGGPSAPITFNLQPASSSTTTSSPFFSSFPPAPSIATTASNTAKTFASLLGDSSNTGGSKPNAAAPTPSSATDPSVSTNGNKHAVDYYISLRGLNLSLLDAVTKYIQDDPFIDIGELLERYKNLRTTVQKEFESHPIATASSLSSSSIIAPASASKTEPPKPLAMPAPPTAFAGFGTQSKPSSAFGNSSTSNDVPSSSSPGFSLGSSTTTSSTTTSTFSVGAGSSSSGPSSFFSMPSKDSSATSNPFAPSPASSSSAPTSFFGSRPSSSAPSPFTIPFSTVSETQKTMFGGGSSSSIFDTKIKETDKSAVPSFNPFAIPSSSTPPSGSTTSPFGTFRGFGKSSSSSGSIGNPVGYGFGSPSAPATPEGESSTTPKPTLSSTFGSTPSVFSNVGKAKSEDGASSGNEAGTDDAGSQAGESTSGSQGDASGKEGTALPAGFGMNPHDEEGEGEEMEDTVHQVKSKAFRLRKSDEKGASGWAEIGYGILRLKKNRETGSRRLLLRNSTTGKININFNIYSALKPSQIKKAVTFIGHDDGASQTYSVRLGTEQQAKELKEVLEREIAFVKAKEGPS